MIDTETIKSIIKEFAEEYSFIQEIDIIKVETSVFNRENYFEMNDKSFISMNEYIDKTEIIIGKINIEMDTIEEEWYYIDKDKYFIVNISDSLTADSLIESIITECKNYKLIY